MTKNSFVAEVTFKKRSGPRAEPCGTTQITDIKSELQSLMETNCLQSYIISKT